MSAPHNSKPLPIQAVWLGPPDGRDAVVMDANLRGEGVQITKRVVGVRGDESMPAGTQVALVLDGMCRGELLRRCKDCALAAKVPMILVGRNARRTREAIAAAGIRPGLAPVPAPTAYVGRDEPLRATVGALAMQEALSDAPRLAPVPAPTALPPFVVPDDVRPEAGQMSLRKYNLARLLLATLDGGPASEQAMAELARAELGLPAHGFIKYVNAMLHWLREGFFVVPAGKDGRLNTWSRTSNPADDEALGAYLSQLRRNWKASKRVGRQRAQAATRQPPVVDAAPPAPQAPAVGDADLARLRAALNAVDEVVDLRRTVADQSRLIETLTQERDQARASLAAIRSALGGKL